jgi:hypothetical protein
MGGGSYVTGMLEQSFGYAAPHAVQVRVAAYDASGKLLAEKVDEINSNDLVISHLNPRPRAPYAVFLHWEPSQIAKVTVIEFSGHTAIKHAGHIDYLVEDHLQHPHGDQRDDQCPVEVVRRR